jgi:hypothetical protein
MALAGPLDATVRPSTVIKTGSEPRKSQFQPRLPPALFAAVSVFPGEPETGPDLS